MPEIDQSSNVVVASSSPDAGVLDNPIWNALNTEHRSFAIGGELAKRYPPEIGPLSGLVEQSDAAYEDLRNLTRSGGMTAQFLAAPVQLRPGWELVRDGLMSQMIWLRTDAAGGVLLPNDALLRPLTGTDVPAMLELTALTEPGPFGPRTHELGAFLGIFESERLVAMAGQRTRVPGFVEVSAVCTHPDARGRGYARAAMLEVMADIVRNGATPYLHVFAANESAIRVYEGLGFTQRRELHLAVLKAV